MKQRLIATLLIVIAWTILDIIVHGNLLMGIYEQTAQLWRPEAEMKAGFMNATSIATALLFVMIFCQLVKDKTRNKGIKLGLLVGLLVGTFSGLGSYAYMPIPLNLAIGWFAAQTVKFTVAGFITGSVVKSDIK